MFDWEIITPEGFKTLFSRDFPYLPVWDETKIYFINDIVYYTNNFYISLTDENVALPTDSENWKVYNDNVANYISDEDIQRAFLEAKVNFNPMLFSNNEECSMAFYYLTAHYLVIDLNNAQNPLALGGMGIVSSKSVGSVSESRQIPSWIMNDKNLGLYALTGYGLKYLSLIMPKLTGNIIFTRGAISFM